MDPINTVIQGVTEGPNLPGSTPTQVPQGLGPSPSADTPFRFGIEGSPITTEDRQAEQMTLDSLRPSLGQMAVDGAHDWALSWAYQEMGDLAPAGAPVEDADIDDFMKTTKPVYWELVQKAQSKAHLAKLKQFAIEDEEREQRWSAAGYTGLGVRLLMSIFDPTAIAVTAATDGVAAPMIAGMKVGKLAKIGLHALSGGVSNAALELVNQEVNPKTSELAVAEAFGIGLVFGGTYGILRRHPELQAEANEMNRIGKLNVKEAQKKAALHDKNLSAGGSGVESLNPLSDTMPIIDADVPRPAFKKVRWDNAAKAGGTEESKLGALMAPELGEEGVGLTTKGTVSIAASERGGMMHRARMLYLRNKTAPEWSKYGKDIGLPVHKRLFPGKAYKEWQDMISDAIENESPMPGQYHPTVLAAAQQHKEFYSWYAGALNNPGSLMGKVMRSVRGAEQLLADPLYFPKIMDPTKINAVLQKYGRGTVETMVKEAILDLHPKLDVKYAARIAKGYTSRIEKAAYGIDDGFANAFRSPNKDSIRSQLIGIGIDEADINEILDRMVKPDKVGDPRLHRRSPLNYRYGREFDTRLGTRERLSMRDLFVTDAEEAAFRYSRRISGKVAIAQIEVRNPDTGELIVNGITDAAEWDKYIEWVKSEMAAKGLASTDGRFKATVDSLQNMYDHIVGNPMHKGESYVPWLRRLGTYNVIRLMNRMGLNQAQELGMMVSQVGIKSMMSQMPTLRRIINDDGISQFKNVLANELESWGVLGDAHFSAERFSVMDEMIGETSSQTRVAKLGQKIDNFHTVAQGITSNISLMRPVNAILQQWTARSVVQRFSDMAFGRGVAGISGKKMDRLKALGLSEDMAERAFGQIRQHATRQGRKIEVLNLSEWSDQEAAHAFIHTVSRYTRRVVLENDIGSMHRWMTRPGTKLLFQFRSFIFSAWAKRTLYNLHHLDFTSFTTTMAELMLGSATHALNVQVNAPAQQNPEKYKDEQLSMKRLATAGIARAGIASVLPAVADTVTSTLGQGAHFDARTSGTASDFFLSSPYVDIPRTMSMGVGGVLDAFVDGRPVPREAVNNLARTAPWGNNFLMPTLLGLTMKNNPYRAPRDE